MLLAEKSGKFSLNMDFCAEVIVTTFTNLDKTGSNSVITLNNVKARLSVIHQRMLLETEGSPKLIVNCDLESIVAVNLTSKEARLQFKPDYSFEQCILKFEDGTLLLKFSEFLQPLPKPDLDIDQSTNSSSTSDWNDSGTGRTRIVSTSSENSSSH